MGITKYHTTNKCTNCMSFILNHFFKTLFTAPTCFDSVCLSSSGTHSSQLKSRVKKLLLHVSIAYRLSSTGSTYSSQLKSRVKNTNFFVIVLLWQHIRYMCTLFLVQGGKWTASLCQSTYYLHQKKITHKYMICWHNTNNKGIFIILTREFSQELYVLPDDDKRYAIETCMSSEKCFKKAI